LGDRVKIRGFLLNSRMMKNEDFASHQIGIGVVCADLDESIDFYTGVIGLKRTRSFDIDADFAERAGLTPGISFHVEVLATEDRPDASSLKLLTFGRASAHSRALSIADGVGVQYITLQLKSLNPVLERIRKHRVDLMGESPVPMGKGDRYFALVQAPEGTFVELIGPLNS